MLTTDTYTIDEAVAELEDTIETLEGDLESLDPDEDEAQASRAEAIQGRLDSLRYYVNGLEWQANEWDGDDELTIGAMTAGEKAMMHREVPEHAEPQEIRLWYVAAALEAGPPVRDSLQETFREVANCHPGFVEWVEAIANGLSVPGGGVDEGNAEPSST